MAAYEELRDSADFHRRMRLRHHLVSDSIKDDMVDRIKKNLGFALANLAQDFNF